MRQAVCSPAVTKLKSISCTILRQSPVGTVSTPGYPDVKIVTFGNTMLPMGTESRPCGVTCAGNFWWTADMRSVGRRPCWSAALDFALLPLPLYLALLLVETATLFSIVGYSTPSWATQCAIALHRSDGCIQGLSAGSHKVPVRCIES